MTKIDKDLNKITKRLKTFKMARHNGGELPTYGCIFDGQLECSKNSTIIPEWDSMIKIKQDNIITKVLTNKDQFNNELHIAQYLHPKILNTSNQDHILYCIKALIINKEVLTLDELKHINTCKFNEPNKDKPQFNKTSNTFYVLEYYNGGINLEQFISKYLLHKSSITAKGF